MRGRKRSLIKLDVYQFLTKDLPVDLLFEVRTYRVLRLCANSLGLSQVLGHLHPIDLYHLSHATKALCNIVMARWATSLWKTAFSRHPDVPQCPPKFSQPQWAAVLFGPDICDVSSFHLCHPRSS